MAGLFHQMCIRDRIDTLDISFTPGFSVITGETGAGKSIILGAIGSVSYTHLIHTLQRERVQIQNGHPPICIDGQKERYVLVL